MDRVYVTYHLQHETPCTTITLQFLCVGKEKSNVKITKITRHVV